MNKQNGRVCARVYANCICIIFQLVLGYQSRYSMHHKLEEQLCRYMCLGVDLLLFSFCRTPKTFNRNFDDNN